MGEFPSWFSNNSQSQIYYLNPRFDDNGEPLLCVWKRADNYFHLRYSDHTEFLVSDNGSSVFARWPETLTLEDTATYLLGPILAFVLLLRGIVSLHASAIAIDNRVVVLVGPAGAGKSTTAAAFARKGYSILSDDVAIIDDHGLQFFVQPSYPRIRLWPESVRTLCGADDALPLLTPTWGKRFLDLTTDEYRFQTDALPLAGIYILEERLNNIDLPKVTKSSFGEGLKALVANTYATYLKDKRMRAQEFDLLGRLVSNVPVRLLTPHEDPAYLDRLCAVVVEDFQQQESVRNV